MTITKDYIHNVFVTKEPEFLQHFVGRALMVLLRNQTADEQRDAQTKLDNGRGFTSGDAYSGTITAKYYMKHGKLADWQLKKWNEKRVAKYWRQLNEAATRKANEKAAT